MSFPSDGTYAIYAPDNDWTVRRHLAGEVVAAVVLGEGLDRSETRRITRPLCGFVYFRDPADWPAYVLVDDGSRFANAYGFRDARTPDELSALVVLARS